MEIYECVKGFSVTVFSDSGTSTDKEKIIKEGTVWSKEDDAVNMIGGEVHLDRVFKAPKAKTIQWIEITNERFRECFARKG